MRETRERLGSVKSSVPALARHAVAVGFLQGLSRATELASPLHVGPNLRRFRVLGGPLRGLQLVVPSFWRPSYALGTYEPHVLRAVQSLPMTGCVAYDVGANVGYFSAVFSRLVGPRGLVFSFEPDPRNAAALEATVRINRLDNVRPVRSAISDMSGSATLATFTYPSITHIANPRTPGDAVFVTVPCITIDDFVYRDGNPAPSLLKIDVEGAEDRVFRGAVRTLRETRPVVVAEVRCADTWPEIAALASANGYESCVLSGWARDGIVDVLLTP